MVFLATLAFAFLLTLCAHAAGRAPRRALGHGRPARWPPQAQRHHPAHRRPGPLWRLLPHRPAHHDSAESCCRRQLVVRLVSRPQRPQRNAPARGPARGQRLLRCLWPPRRPPSLSRRPAVSHPVWRRRHRHRWASSSSSTSTTRWGSCSGAAACSSARKGSPGGCSGPLTVFWYMGMMNTINLLDGASGLVAGVTAILCAVLAIHMILARRAAAAQRRPAAARPAGHGAGLSALQLCARAHLHGQQRLLLPGLCHRLAGHHRRRPARHGAHGRRAARRRSWLAHVHPLAPRPAVGRAAATISTSACSTWASPSAPSSSATGSSAPHLASSPSSVASTIYKVIALAIVTAIALAVLIWAARAEVRG